ncbi:MAG TPA: DUF493 family protein [Rubrivivax sp.]|nr:DUF493 family protein [Rubrivivax sp.]
MGANEAAFEQEVLAIARQFDPDYDPDSLERRPSRSGNYMGLTLHVTATSRQQLDDLYRALSGHPLVKVVL